MTLKLLWSSSLSGPLSLGRHSMKPAKNLILQILCASETGCMRLFQLFTWTNCDILTEIMNIWEILGVPYCNIWTQRDCFVKIIFLPPSMLAF